MSRSQRPRRRGRPDGGQALVEFALLLPAFLLLFAATLDLGRVFLARISIANAAREGAMQAAQTPTSFLPGSPCDPAATSLNLVMCRTLLEAKGSTVDVQPADVQLVCSPSGCAHAMGNTVTVTVTGHFKLLTPLMSPFFGGSQDVTFASVSTAQIEALPSPGTAPAPTPTPTPAPTPSATAIPTATPQATCAPPSAGFTATPVTGTSPLVVRFSDTSTSSSACPILTWTWAFGDKTSYTAYTAGQTPPPHTYLSQNKNQPGVYEVTLTVTNAAGSNTSAAQTITANP